MDLKDLLSSFMADISTKIADMSTKIDSLSAKLDSTNEDLGSLRNELKSNVGLITSRRNPNQNSLQHTSRLSKFRLQNRPYPRLNRLLKILKFAQTITNCTYPSTPVLSHHPTHVVSWFRQSILRKTKLTTTSTTFHYDAMR